MSHDDDGPSIWREGGSGAGAGGPKAEFQKNEGMDKCRFGGTPWTPWNPEGAPPPTGFPPEPWPPENGSCWYHYTAECNEAGAWVVQEVSGNRICQIESPGATSWTKTGENDCKAHIWVQGAGCESGGQCSSPVSPDPASPSWECCKDCWYRYTAVCVEGEWDVSYDSAECAIAAPGPTGWTETGPGEAEIWVKGGVCLDAGDCITPVSPEPSEPSWLCAPCDCPCWEPPCDAGGDEQLKQQYQVIGGPVPVGCTGREAGPTCIDLDIDWDGTFQYRGSHCVWYDTTNAGVSNFVCWNGLRTQYPVTLGLIDSQCRWSIHVSIGGNDTTSTIHYYKSTGSTPVGVYQVEAGCNAVPQTLEIVEVA